MVMHGRHDVLMSASGRIALPFLRNTRIFLTNMLSKNERHLVGHLPESWDEAVEELSQAQSAAERLFSTFYVGGSYEMEVDGDGRLDVPAKLREFARLGTCVTFVGMTNKFWLIDPKADENVMNRIEETLERICRRD